jgi:hypothetical protein
MKASIAALAIAISCTPALAEKGGWVHVTRPVVACELPNWELGTEQDVKDRCTPNVLNVGELFAEDGLNVEVLPGVVEIWRGVCPRGCVPAMMPLFVRRADYESRFKKIPTPKNWE